MLVSVVMNGRLDTVQEPMDIGEKVTTGRVAVKASIWSAPRGGSI